MKQRQPGQRKPQGLRLVKNLAARKQDKDLVLVAKAAAHVALVGQVARVQVPTPGMHRCRCGSSVLKPLI
jgi:CDGSH-type Zn-finger protein